MSVLVGRLTALYQPTSASPRRTESMTESNRKSAKNTAAVRPKGSEAENQREHGEAFTARQRFRAGIEGSISFLKLALRLARCFKEGWKH